MVFFPVGLLDGGEERDGMRGKGKGWDERKREGMGNGNREKRGWGRGKISSLIHEATGVLNWFQVWIASFCILLCNGCNYVGYPNCTCNGGPN